MANGADCGAWVYPKSLMSRLCLTNPYRAPPCDNLGRDALVRRGGGQLPHETVSHSSSCRVSHKTLGFQDAPRPLVGHISESGVVIDSGMDVVEPDRVFRSRVGRGLANRRCRGCG